MLPDYAALRYSRIINYPPPQLIAHKIFPVPSYCPRICGPLLPIAHEFLFNYQEKLNNAPCLTHCPLHDAPATGRVARNCPPSGAAMPYYSGRSAGNCPTTLTERALSKRSLLRTSPKATVRRRAKQRCFLTPSVVNTLLTKIRNHTSYCS